MGMTLHKMRHTHASHMLAANVHPKIVQERLEHSSICYHAGYLFRAGQ